MLGLGNILTKGGAVLKFPNDYSFNFDGSNDYLDIDITISPATSCSISAWIYVEGTNNAYILDARTNSGTGYIQSLGGTSLSTAGSGSATIYVNGVETTTIVRNQWQHICYSGISLESTKIVFGKYFNAGSSSTAWFDGLIDEVAIWDTALSADDVAKIASKPVDLSKPSKYATDRTGNLKLWLRAGDKAEPESTTAIARQDFYTDFDGTDDYVSVADNDDLSFGSGSADSPLSISAWINPVDATNFTIVSKGVFNTDAEYIFQLDGNDKLYFALYDESVDNTFEGAYFNTALTSYQGSWFHVCATYNGVGGTSANAGIKLYIDGVEKSTVLTGGGTYVAMENLGGELEIGRIGSTYANGKISNLAIHQTELDAQTISQMAKSRFTPMRDNRFSVVDFDGVNDFIDIPDNDALDAGSGDMTITFWYNPLSMSANMEIIDKYDTSSNKGYRVRHHYTTSKVWFNINDGADTDGYYSYIDVALSYGQWYHVTIIWDNSEQQATYYINGVNYGRAFATNLRAIGDTSNSVPLRFGGTQAGGSDYKGSISSVAIYNVARTSEEDYACYQKGITHNPSADTGLVGLWRMGDDTSKAYPTIADSSSNSNDGTASGAVETQQMVAGYDLGAFESSSEELNGEVISGSDWTPDSGITVSNGSLVFNTSTQFNKAIDTTAVSGKFYKTVFTISNYVSGSVKIRIGAFGEERSGNGTYTEYITSTTANVEFYAYTDGSNDFTIENISVKEVLQSEVSDTYPAIIDVNEPVLGVEISGDPTFDNASNWSISSGNGGVDVNTTVSGKLSVVNAQDTRLYKYSILTVGKLYKVTFVIDSYSSGRVRGLSDASITFIPTGAGTYSRYFVASNTYFLVSFDGTANMTMTDISIKEIQGNVGTMTNQASSDLVYSSVLPDQSFLTGANSSYGFGSFDGTNDIVTASAVNTDYKSVSLWIKPSTTITPASSGSELMFFGNWTFGSVALGSQTGDFTNELITLTDNDGVTKKTAWIPSSGETIPNDSWTHLAFVWDGSKYVIYYNGQPQTVVTASNGHAPLNTNKNIRIGTGGASSTSFFGGDITGVGFWNKSLTDAQILSIYNNGRHSNLYTDFSDNLITYLAFGNSDATSGFEDTSSTIYDRSGKSNHGTVSGTTLQSPPNAEPNGYAKGDTNRSTTTP